MNLKLFFKQNMKGQPIKKNVNLVNPHGVPINSMKSPIPETKSTPKPSPKPSPPKDMEIEKNKNEMDLDELIKNSFVMKKTEFTDLTNETSKKASELFKDCHVIRDVKLAGDIHFKLIENDKGYLVDIRRNFRGNPSKKGIMMTAKKFMAASEVIGRDLRELMPDSLDIFKD